MTDTPASPQGADESALHNTPADPPPHYNAGEGDHEVVEGADKRADTDTEEIEHGGARYRIPAVLKSAFMLQADYDARTRELSEQRRTLETRVHAQEQRLQERAQDIARIGALDLQLKSFEAAWQKASQENPAAAQTIWMRWQHLKEQRAGALSELQRKEAERAKEQNEERARAHEAGRAVLARDIRNWSPDLARKVHGFATAEFDLKPDEIAAIDDPRLIKVLHRAFVGDAAIRKLAAAEKLAASEALKPVTQLGSNAGANERRTTDPSGDRLSTEEWIRREQQRLKQRRS